ncbi:hypothetical protein [Pseudomonas migulae]|uniref:Uncharacterized protein n=1 Tax=Pseudomonas migulae TaxID=78543 RepID=A0ABY8N1Z1_9PSED|nr:hypothetical protein [Pseudomonas migulae]WGK92851.1 hypothetical protein MOQ58_11885 [Pseudomonas migulae]
MPKYYTVNIVDKTARLIVERFGVSPEYAQRLAVGALDGIEWHGGNPENWETVKETVGVVVAGWINFGAFCSKAH